MKKIIFGLAAVAMLAMGSCSKEQTATTGSNPLTDTISTTVDFYLVVAGKLLYGLQHLCANHGAAFGCFARRSCQCGLEGTQEFHFLLGSEVGAALRT